MTKFTLYCENFNDGTRAKFFYDNDTSALTRADGTPVEVVASTPRTFSNAYSMFPVSKETPGVKAEIKTFKVQLGLNCNYACTYCSQRFIPHAAQTNPGHVEKFLEMLPDDLAPDRVEFWGGEPFVYWKTFKPLAEALRKRWPDAEFGVITYGSMLDEEINQWLDDLDFVVGISHDGPGQHVRGPDPFDDPVQKAHILALYDLLRPKQRISFNCMINRHNTSRAAVAEWFKNLLGTDDFALGEGAFIDPYDEGGRENSLHTEDETMAFRRQTLNELRLGNAQQFMVNYTRVREFMDTVANKRPSRVLGQKCGMDRTDNVAVDMRGNVLTCQNLSSVSKAPNGESHKIGHITDMKGVRLKTSTHWSKRNDCSACPVLHLCKGSCMYLEGDLWELSCNNAFSDHIPYFASAIEWLTGYVPFYIVGGRDDRRDLFGMGINSVEEAEASLAGN